MANVKFTGLMPVASLETTDIFALSRVSGTPVSLSATSQVISDFVTQNLTLSGGDGIDFVSLTGVISADINTTNLKFTTNEINTIQDIATSSSPTFNGLLLDGFLSNPEGFQGANQIATITVSQVIDANIFGSTLLSESVSDVDLTIPLGLVPPANTEFDMIRGGSGNFNLVAVAGVNINGVDGDTISLPQEWDRAKVRYIKPNEWSAIEYSGAVGSVTNQEVYDNSPSGIVNLIAGKPAGYTSNVAGFILPSMTEAQFDAIVLPDNGLIGWSSDLDRIRVNKGTSGSPVYDNLAYESDIASITADGAIGESYFSGNATETVIAVQGTPVKVAGTYNSGTLFNMSQSGGTLTNTSSDTLDLAFVATMTVTTSVSTADIKGYIYKNGVTPISVSTPTVSVDGVIPSFKTLTVSGFLSLAPTETGEVFVSNESNTDNITVESINFKLNTVGAASGTGDNDLEVAYTVGDGTMISTIGKPLEFQSNDNSIISTFNFRQTTIPLASQIIGRSGIFSLNSASSAKEWSRFETAATNPTNTTEASDVNFYGRTVVTFGTSNLVNYGSYRGESVDFDHSVQGLGDFNFSTLLTLGTQNRNVSSNLGAVIVPTTTYPNFANTSVWQTVDGSVTVAPNSLPVGSTIEIKCFGKVEAFVDDIVVGTEAFFNITFGGIINLNSSNVFPSIPPGGYEGDFEWTFRIIRTNSTSLAVVGNGMYVSGNGARTTISFPSSVWTSAYTASGTYTIGVNLDKTNLNVEAPGFFNYVCRGLTINQF